jgi:hypothetical protein
MAICTAQNQYASINPHFNSLLQTPGSPEWGFAVWPTFHAHLVVAIADALNDTLPSRYVARAERSLQIKLEHWDGPPLQQRRQPDISVYATAEAGGQQAVALDAAAPTVLVLDETLDADDEDFVTAVVVYAASDDPAFGRSVTRIELLSPSNLGQTVGYDAYRRGRTEALFSGILLVEIDLLHEYPPPMRRVALYPQQMGSHAYHIYISDPHPTIKQGRFVDYGFDVGMACPRVSLPLAGDEQISFDFDEVYQRLYVRGRWGSWNQKVDYEQLPARFETYSSADQGRIRERMAAIREALLNGDLPV